MAKALFDFKGQKVLITGGASGIQAGELTYIAKLVGVTDLADGDFIGA